MTRLYVLVKMMKKIRSLIYIIIVCLMCGCAGTADYTGRSDIEKARKLHSGLEGAKITMTDNTTSEIIQEISYVFVGEVMTYMYHGEQDGKSYYEFNNGTELDYITLPDETEWSFCSRGDENYYSYSRTAPHYFADGKQLFATYSNAISTATSVSEDDGDTVYTYTYNGGGLADYNLFEGTAPSDFIMSYRLNEDGYCTEFRNMYTLDGTRYDYTVTISEMNAIEKVERTEVLK